nr:putative pentatricopeptide repeat-containing protein At1g12700, mitochondrial [Ipomoea trifida]
MSWRRIRTAISTPIFAAEAGTLSSEPSLRAFHSRPQTVSSNQSKFEKSSNDLDDALKLFRQMAHNRPLPSVIQFNKLLSRILKLKHYSVVVSLFQEMRIKGIPISVYTINILVDVYCRSSRVDCGFCVLGVVFKCGFEFNVVTFTTLIKGLLLDNKIVEAVGLFKKLVRENVCKVDQITYGVLINGLCKAGVYIFSILVDALCKEGKLESAETIIQIMIQRKIYPDVVTYNPLIEGYCLQGRMDEARKAFGRVVESGLQPNVWTYNTLINGYCKIKEIDEARKAFGQMVESGLQPNVWTYSTLINGYCKIKEMDEAMHLFCEIPQKGLHPDVVTYTTMLQGFFLVRRCSAALQLFQEMLVAGHKPDLYTSCVLLGVCKMGQLNIARNVFNDLISKGRRLDVNAYNVMINGLCRGGFLDEALELLRKMEKNDCLPNTVTYNVILQEFVREKKWHEANLLLDEMVGKGISPNHCTFFVINDLLALKTGDETVLKVIQKFAANHVK